jgi:phosphate uptake regulator
LPTAVVAEELGLSIGLVEALIQYGEIEPTDTSEESRRDRVSRDELARVIEFGLDELLRLHEQDAAQIFEDALRHLQDGDLEAAEKAYRRIEVRDSLIGHYAMAYRIGLDLAKSNFDEAKSTINFVLREEQIERTATLSYLARLLRSIRFNEHTAEVTREHLLALADGGEFDPYRYAGSYSSKQIGKHLDETQQHAMYVATAVDQALKNYKFRNQFLRFNDRNSPMREEEFNSIIRNAIYTALHAEATYSESAASKMYADTLKSLIPRWWAPAELLESLPRKSKKEAEKQSNS